MKKKDIKSFFKAIRERDSETVKNLLEVDEAYLSVTNFSPPKKDDGQSGLQVAFKVAAFPIAELLIEKGADVNFQEISEVNQWTAPVLHDCIRATIFNCLTLKDDPTGFETGMKLLELMLSKGAEPNSRDSYGNSCLNRAFLDSVQMINNPNFKKQDETLSQLRRVFRTLISFGANIEEGNDKRESLAEQVKSYGCEKYELI